jgi:diguanylate cyclase (GGDEF)-like protein
MQIMTGNLRSAVAALRALLPHGGSLPYLEWERRHKLIVALLWLAVVVVGAYGVLARGSAIASYIPELASMVAFAVIAGWSGPSREWRSISASMGLLTASASLVDISGGLIEMHFSFFVVVVLLTLYEDWFTFLLAVAFVLLHHGIMGTLDPRAVFDNPAEWSAPWAWAALHAMFVALAGVAGVAAWRLNEQVRERMRATQEELERISLTDALTGLRNRRCLMADLEKAFEERPSAALAMFDLNGFKEYNDRFGHQAGDSLLVRLSARLRENVGAAGSAYRLGGDEFCVLVTAAADMDLESQALRWASSFTEHGEGFSVSAAHGAALIPTEAGDPSEALRVCDRRMYISKHRGRTSAARQTRDVLLAMLAARDSELSEHVSDVALVAQRVGVELGLGPEALQELGQAAELHDIGKIAIPDSIIGKPGPLDEEEWEFMRRHTVIGERILNAAPALARVAQIVRATHERWDGSGYPDGIVAENILLPARIISVCDAYHAMTSSRPYGTVATPTAAIKELRRCAGTQFDPRVVDAFARVVEQPAIAASAKSAITV